MLKEKVIAKSKEIGFDLIGFTPCELLKNESNFLSYWLGNSYNAGMEYMDRNFDKRIDANEILEDCKSVISLGMNYFVKGDFESKDNSGKVSRYAWGRDYHYTIWEKLEELTSYIESLETNIKTKSYVDTGPVMDKAWAVRAGIGWQGKHSNVINKEIGSWFFIANVFLNIEFESYNDKINDFCGSCTACIDACPTNAIVEEYVVDSNKCISYLTIENKNEISKNFVGNFNNWIFGCDICQDVCPWNIKFAEGTNISDFQSVQNKTVDLDKILTLSNREFNDKYYETPLLRAKAKGLKRNAMFLKKK